MGPDAAQFAPQREERAECVISPTLRQAHQPDIGCGKIFDPRAVVVKYDDRHVVTASGEPLGKESQLTLGSADPERPTDERNAHVRHNPRHQCSGRRKTYSSQPVPSSPLSGVSQNRRTVRRPRWCAKSSMSSSLKES